MKIKKMIKDGKEFNLGGGTSITTEIRSPHRITKFNEHLELVTGITTIPPEQFFTVAGNEMYEQIASSLGYSDFSNLTLMKIPLPINPAGLFVGGGIAGLSLLTWDLNDDGMPLDPPARLLDFKASNMFDMINQETNLHLYILGENISFADNEMGYLSYEILVHKQK